MVNLHSVLRDTDVLDELREHLKSGHTLLKAPGIDLDAFEAVIANRYGDYNSAKIARETSHTGLAAGNEALGTSGAVPATGGTMPVVEEAVVIVQDFLRPCLIIQKGTFDTPESSTWTSRLNANKKMLERVIPAAGRIEFKWHPQHEWGGTGWLVDQDIIVTNRHVAQLFAERKGSKFIFLDNGIGIPIEARIDFIEELTPTGQIAKAQEITVKEVIMIAEPKQPDIAILRLEKPVNIAPLQLLAKDPVRDQLIAVIGYPARDDMRNPMKVDDAKRIFNNVYSVKRLSPGTVLNPNFAPFALSHDCTTLGGMSGSAVIDLETGAVAGLHFGGLFRQHNYAVKPSIVLDHLAAKNIKVKTAGKVKPSIDDGYNEATNEKYTDRDGYDAAFMSKGYGGTFDVPLPSIDDESVVLEFKAQEEKGVLKYCHFSVVMHNERRLCIYSAANLHGGKSKKTKRPGWKYDGRIPRSAQIKDECYGSYPLFSRGHMTRREDPAWGTTALANLGNKDSMHVTNAVPQMQSMNAGEWLKLEDYALQNARGDEMMITVFTGPFFNDDDPIIEGVKIPVDFWKVLAFVHDETGELCATGYVMSQKEHLANEEFIYGQFLTYQTSISSIETKAGLKFGDLSTVDPYEGTESFHVPIKHYDHIQWRKQ